MIKNMISYSNTEQTAGAISLEYGSGLLLRGTVWDSVSDRC